LHVELYGVNSFPILKPQVCGFYITTKFDEHGGLVEAQIVEMFQKGFI